MSLPRDYKHLSVPFECYESLCEQQKRMSIQLSEEKNDLVSHITRRCNMLQNARLYVEYLIE